MLYLTYQPLTYVHRIHSVQLSQYPGRWYCDSLRRMDITTHGINYIGYVGSCLIWGRISITCVISMRRNDIKCKYMFFFPLKKYVKD